MRHSHRKKPLFTPSYGQVSLSTRDFRWLHSEGWNSELSRYFAGKRSALPLVIFAAPPFVSPRQPSLYRWGRWILTKSGSDIPLSWAEVQIIPGSFMEAWLFIGERQGERWGQGSSGAELSLLISMIMISSKADLINLAFVMPKDRKEFLPTLPKAYGETRDIVTPVRFGSQSLKGPRGLELAEPTVRLSVRRFSRSDWEESDIWSHDKETLRYLRKKVSADDSDLGASLRSSRRRQGGRNALSRLLQRISSRLRGD